MEGPPLGPGGEDISWPDQVAPRGQKASSTRKIKPQTSNLLGSIWVPKEENLRRRGLYCLLVLSETLMEKQGSP